MEIASYSSVNVNLDEHVQFPKNVRWMVLRWMRKSAHYYATINESPLCFLHFNKKFVSHSTVKKNNESGLKDEIRNRNISEQNQLSKKEKKRKEIKNRKKR